jgi:hypothetical protein
MRRSPKLSQQSLADPTKHKVGDIVVGIEAGNKGVGILELEAGIHGRNGTHVAIAECD